jgi:mannitol/fructose-specific phosphotransferase system IIA component (Ntr-type)
MKQKPITKRSAIFIVLDLKGRSRDEILSNIALFAKRHGLIQNEQMLYKEFLEREKQGTTAIGNGVALPEACWIQMSRPYAFILCRTKELVSFNSLDGEPVRIVLASLGRDRDDLSRLKPMSYLVRLLKSPASRSKLIYATSESEVIELFKKHQNTPRKVSISPLILH